MDKKYFIVLCSVVDSEDPRKVITYAESFHEISQYELAHTAQLISGESSTNGLDRYLNTWKLRQRLNPHRFYENFVVTVSDELESELIQLLSSETLPVSFLDLIRSRGLSVRL